MINASKDYLTSFFRGEIQYVVPFFQRPYVWDTDNWEILWDNIYEVLKGFQNGNNNEHFIGTLIIKQKQANRLGDNIYDLIDGQQRLTTFALLIKALADTCRGELENLGRKLSELIVFEDSKAQRFIRIIHNRTDRPYFEAVMLNEEGTFPTDNKIVRAYKYFYEKVKDFTDEERDIILKIILNKVPVISMLISADDDEQEIFDTINSLGVKLTTAELLKNFIFKEEELKRLYESHWQSIYEIDDERINFWNKDKTSGRIIRTNIEVLLYCYLIIQTKKDVKLEKLYKEYKNWLKEKTVNEKIDFLESLRAYSEFYYQLPEGEELNEFSYSEYEKRFFHIIENLSVTTAYPLIIFLYKEIYNRQDLANYLLLLESYLVRRNICKLTAKNYNNLFISILQKLISIKEKNGRFTFEDFKNILLNFNDDTNLFPDDNLFKNLFKKSILTNQYSKEILYCIALYQKSNDLNDVKKLSSSSFSVEHIMPKKWVQNWNVNNMSEQEKSKRNEVLLTLGNLTLISRRLNSKLKNDSWNNKKGTLRQYSSLKMTTDYLTLNNWNEDTIKQRSEYLLDLALEIWKR